MMTGHVMDGRLKKCWRSLMQRISIYSSDSPDQEELELVQEQARRALLVIKARWIMIVLLTIYGLLTGGFYILGGYYDLIKANFLIPAMALLAVAAYNAWYHYSYQWFSHLKFLNHAQVVFDMLVITILVHFSGGVVSWFWTMYLLLIIEAALLIERKMDTWILAGFASLLYGGLLTAEYYRIIPPVAMPFEDSSLQHNFTYEMIVWLWVMSMNMSVAIISTYLMGVIRKREEELKKAVITDALTGLYNRTYFFHRLSSEIERCKRYDRFFSVLMLDLDNFKLFNDTFGHLEGDKLLKNVADILKKNIRRGNQDNPYDVDIPCRYGGEEFAILLPETSSQDSLCTAERLREEVRSQAALRCAERIRKQIEKMNTEGKGITVSIGVSVYKHKGLTCDDMIKAADMALYKAKQMGKNRVVLAS